MLLGLDREGSTSVQCTLRRSAAHSLIVGSLSHALVLVVLCLARRPGSWVVEGEGIDAPKRSLGVMLTPLIERERLTQQ